MEIHHDKNSDNFPDSLSKMCILVLFSLTFVLFEIQVFHLKIPRTLWNQRLETILKYPKS